MISFSVWQIDWERVYTDISLQPSSSFCVIFVLIKLHFWQHHRLVNYLCEVECCKNRTSTVKNCLSYRACCLFMSCCIWQYLWWFMMQL